MPFVLIIGEKGNSWAGRPSWATLHTSREEAEAQLLDYVQNSWDSKMDGDERPEDPDEMIEEYFEVALERYEIVFAEPQEQEVRAGKESRNEGNRDAANI